MRWFVHCVFLFVMGILFAGGFLVWLKIDKSTFSPDLNRAVCQIDHCTGYYCYANASIPYSNSTIPCTLTNVLCVVNPNDSVPGVPPCMMFNQTTGTNCTDGLGGQAGIPKCYLRNLSATYCMIYLLLLVVLIVNCVTYFICASMNCGSEDPSNVPLLPTTSYGETW